MDRVLTSAQGLLNRPTILLLLESRQLLNLLLIRSKDFLNRSPTIIPFSRPPPPPSSSSLPCRNNNSHGTPDLPPQIPNQSRPTWYNKLAAYYRDHLCDTVPYTNRTRLLLFSLSTERWLGNSFFKIPEDVLPPTHPYSRRAKRFLDRFIQTAVPRACITKPIPPFDWEVVVRRTNNFHAECLPGGKIIFSTSMLKYLTSDAEFARLFAHEVAHAIARHHAEDATKRLLLLLSHIILLPQFPFLGFLSGTLWTLFLKFTHNQRTELEADYIGLLLFASVGYDPRKVPKMYKKFRQTPSKKKSKFSTLIDDYFSSTTTYEKRVQITSQAMEEAMAIYRERIATSNGVEKVRRTQFSI